MPSIITLKNIEDAIKGLSYKSETTLKSKLIRAIRNYYIDESSMETLTSINSEELVKFIWDTGDDSALIKSKKKNFSSVKSSVNSDLKKIYQQGNNPQGIIINSANLFDISEEAKNRALADVADIVREKDIDTADRISPVKEIISKGAGDKALAGIVDILRDDESDIQNKVSKISEVIQEMLSEAISHTGAQLDSTEAEEIRKLFGDLPVQRKTAPPAESGSGVGNATAGINDVPQAHVPEASGIINSVNEMLADALAVNASGLNDSDSEQIKNLFGQLAGKIKSALEGGRRLDDIGVAAAWEGAGKGTGAGSLPEAVIEEVPSTEEAEIDLNPEDLENVEIVETVDEFAKDESEFETDPDSALLPSEDDLLEETFSEEIDSSAAIVDEDVVQAADEPAAAEAEDFVDELVDSDTEEITDVLAEVSDNEQETTIADAEEINEEFSPEIGIEDISTVEEPEIDLSPEGLENVEVVEQIDEVAENESAGTAVTEETELEEIPEEIPSGDIEDAGEEMSFTDQVETEQSAKQSVEALGDSAALPFEDDLLEETFSGETDAGESIVDDFVEIVDEPAQTVTDEQKDEILEEAAEDEFEEVVEEPAGDGDEVSTDGDEITGTTVDEDLRSKADILAELASAAKALEKIGPDLESNIFSEKEIKQKAKLLSEEFDGYLGIRERFYNQHILIKSGDYPIGIGEDGNKLPAQIVNLREFYIGKFPVTNALFEIFVEQTGYITTAEKHGFGMVYIPRMQRVKNAVTGAESFIWNSQLQYKSVPGACWYRPSGPGSTLHVKRTHPVVQVSLEDACAFAAWTGKRIPTEAEWEAASRTSQCYLYPWGNSWQDNSCNLEKSLYGDTSPVDQFIKYANENAVVDSLGNVLEWTLDPWSTSGDSEEGEETYVVKGASWISDCPVSLADRQPVYKDSSSNILGFRCIAI